MQHLGEICWAQHSRGKCGRNAYCVKARRDFQTAGLNGVFGYFCRRGQKYPAPAGAECPFGQSAARVFRACGRGGRMWASAPTHGYRWSFRRGRCPHRPVCRGSAAASSLPGAKGGVTAFGRDGWIVQKDIPRPGAGYFCPRRQKYPKTPFKPAV